MKLKKITSLLFALLLTISVMVGCNDQNNTSSISSSGSASGTSSVSGSSGAASSQVPSGKDIKVKDIQAAIQKAYGEDYLPNTEMDQEMFKNEFQVDDSFVEEAYAEMPMIGMHPDRVVIIKAKEGKGADVEKALNTVKDKLIQDSVQYPMNIAKVNAAQVVRNGDYVVFLLVGAINEDIDASEEDALAFAKKEVQKGVDAVNALFK